MDIGYRSSQWVLLCTAAEMRHSSYRMALFLFIVFMSMYITIIGYNYYPLKSIGVKVFV